MNKELTWHDWLTKARLKLEFEYAENKEKIKPYLFNIEMVDLAKKLRKDANNERI